MSILSFANEYRSSGVVALPSGVSEGDILTVVCVTGNGGETMSLSSGFTNIESGSVLGMTWEVFQKAVGASEPAPVLSTTRTARCISLRSDGITGGAIASLGYGSSNTTYTFPDATAANDNADVLRLGFTQLSGANVVTPPVGTELQDLIVQSVGAGIWSSTASAGAVGTDTLVIDSAKRGLALTLLLESSPASLAIDAEPADIRATESRTITISNPTATPTLLNTTISI